jgi:hypothetical protein
MSRTFLVGVALAATCASLLAPAIARAQPFEGVISLRMAGSREAAGTTQDAEYYASRNGKARISLETPIGNTAIIISPIERKLFLLMESQSAYVEQDLGNAVESEGSADAPPVTRTGRKETIAGHECEVLQVDDKEICVARGLGTYLNVGGNIMQGGMLPWQKAMLKEKLFPLRVTLADGTVQMLVTDIQRKAVDPSMFRVPANYTKMPWPRRGG